jgi:hypothetical protein
MPRPWCDANGNLLRSLPQECIDDCSHPGQSADAAVQEWCERLSFTVPRDVALRYLYHTGVKERAEWNAKSDAELAEWCLWLLCGNAREDKWERDREREKVHKPPLKRFPQPHGLVE